MVRVYLDTNIYAELVKSENIDFLEKLKDASESRILFFYSLAHLNDLHRDKTNAKYDDLRTIEVLCHDNLLCYDGENDSIDYLLIKPLEAYEENKPDDTPIEKFFTDLFNEEIAGVNIGKLFQEQLGGQSFDLGIEEQLKSTDESSKLLYQRLGITKSKYSFMEWMKVVSGMMDKFQNDDSLVKDLRRSSKKHLKVEKFKINIDEINFNDNLKNSVLGKSFLELLEEQLEHTKDKKTGKKTIFNRITTAFNLINIFGFDNEKNKKVKFMNTQHDGQHCYYASVCDIIVSNDKGFREKTKFIYKLYGLRKKIYSFQEFVNNYFLIDEQPIQEFGDFRNQINFDLRNGLVVATNYSVEMQQSDEIIRLNHRYFNHFNRLSRVKSILDDSGQLILYRDSAQIYHPNMLKDYNSIVNLSFKVFGVDKNGQGEFKREELEEIKNNSWQGRHWIISNIDYRLIRNKYSGRINIQIGPVGDTYEI